MSSEKSLTSRPSTIFQSPPEVVTGKEEMRPSGTPYSPFDATATEWKSSPGVAKWMLFTDPMAACVPR